MNLTDIFKKIELAIQPEVVELARAEGVRDAYRPKKEEEEEVETEDEE